MGHEVKAAYGQVYRTLSPEGGRVTEEFPHGAAFRGIVYDETHKEVWWGKRVGSPDRALEDMVGAQKQHGVSDLRAWRGTLS